MKTERSKNTRSSIVRIATLFGILASTGHYASTACDGPNCCVNAAQSQFTGQNRCTNKGTEEDPDGWNCHKATAHAHCDECSNKTMPISHLGLTWGEVIRSGDDGQVGNLKTCDIVIFGINLDDKGNKKDDDLIDTGPHSGTGIGNGDMVWQRGWNPEYCQDELECGFIGCLNVISATTLATRQVYGGKFLVFSKDAFECTPNPSPE